MLQQSCYAYVWQPFVPTSSESDGKECNISWQCAVALWLRWQQLRNQQQRQKQNMLLVPCHQKQSILFPLLESRPTTSKTTNPHLNDTEEHDPPIHQEQNFCGSPLSPTTGSIAWRPYRLTKPVAHGAGVK